MALAPYVDGSGSIPDQQLAASLQNSSTTQSFHQQPQPHQPPPILGDPLAGVTLETLQQLFHAQQMHQQQQQQQHQRAVTKSESIRRSTNLGLTAQDRANPYNRIVCVPHQRVVPTQGSIHYKDDLRMVCLNFQTNTCADGSSCLSLHVDPAYLQRTRLPQGPVCCAAHDDAFSQECLPKIQHCTYQLRLPGGGLMEVKPWSLAVTESLPIPEGNAVCTIESANVCRKHLQCLCKYSKECRNIHLCRERFGFLLSGGNVAPPGGAPPPPPNIVAPVAQAQLQSGGVQRPGVVHQPPNINILPSSQPQPQQAIMMVPQMTTGDPAASMVQYLVPQPGGGYILQPQQQQQQQQVYVVYPGGVGGMPAQFFSGGGQGAFIMASPPQQYALPPQGFVSQQPMQWQWSPQLGATPMAGGGVIAASTAPAPSGIAPQSNAQNQVRN